MPGPRADQQRALGVSLWRTGATNSSLKNLVLYALASFNKLRAVGANMSSNDAKEPSSAPSAIIVGVLIAVIPAIIGYIVSYANGIRKDRLAFTNDQIEKLYGPLHALAQVNDETWTQYVESGQAPDWKNLTKEQVSIWRVWMQNVLQPLNVQIEQTIIANSQLVVGDQLPGVFLKIIGHIESYKALTSTWKQDDIADLNKYTSKSANTVVSPYPANFDLCVGPIYITLKKRQEALRNNIFQAFLLGPVPSPPECDEESSATKKP
jgi:hypothetical protein